MLFVIYFRWKQNKTNWPIRFDKTVDDQGIETFMVM